MAVFDKQISIRLNSEDYERVSLISERLGQKPTSFVRIMMLEKLEEMEKAVSEGKITRYVR